MCNASRDVAAVCHDSADGCHVGFVARLGTTDPRPGGDAFWRREAGQKVLPQVVKDSNGSVAIPEARPMPCRRLDGPVSREQIKVVARQVGSAKGGGLPLLAQDRRAGYSPQLCRADTLQSGTCRQIGVQVRDEEVRIERRRESKCDPLAAADEAQVVMEDCNAHGPGGMGRPS